ncbi:MAG TPA: hypothetical protein VFU02_19520, partial [Polyangiaceae bacterium]|nr:hypothetical protein [Polyangiaceae bacterium]
MLERDDAESGTDSAEGGPMRRWIQKRLHRVFPRYPRVVNELIGETGWALSSWAVLLAAGLVAVYFADPDSSFVDALRHAGLVIVGLAAAWWLVLGTLDIVSALLWYGLFYLDERRGKHADARAENAPDPFTGGWLRKLVIVINRHFLHAWALLAWTVLLVLTLSNPYLIVLALGSLVLLGPTVASWAGLCIAKFSDVDGSYVVRADVAWLRRPAFYLATVVAVFLLLTLEGAYTHWPLVYFSLAVVAAVGIRFSTFLSWLRNYRAQDKDPETALRRRKFRSDLARATKVQDVVVVALALLSPAVFPLLPVFDEQEVARASTLTRVAEWADRTNCEAPLGTESWDVQVFLVADNQFRALDGKPSMGHSPVIDRVVPVAVRPIELDLLSGATLDHFARTYKAARAKWKNLTWAHLGDFSDLGCRSEMARLAGVVESFGGGFLGMAPGNHDSYFTGNFAWHPDWSEAGACPGGGRQGRLGENGTNDHLEKLLIARRGALVSEALAQTDAAKHEFFGRVVPLGSVELDQRKEPVVAAFLDTSDYSDWVWIGAAGVTGAISDEQQQWVLEHLPKNALVMLFQHHPYEALSDGSKARYSKLVSALGRRLVAIVSAHTHTSQRRSPEIAGRKVPQFVVGSTTDPPQEAALLRIRAIQGGYEVDFRTVPAVTRKGLDCGLRLAEESPPSLASASAGSQRGRGPVAIDESACAERLKTLEAECGDLFKTPQRQSGGFRTIAEQRDDQERRAQRVLQCFEKRRHKQVKDKPLSSLDNPYALLGFNCGDDAECKQRGEDGDLQTDLVCLSWAASVLQGHKHSGWTLHLGAKLGLQPLATYAAWASTEKVKWNQSTTTLAAKP